MDNSKIIEKSRESRIKKIFNRQTREFFMRSLRFMSDATYISLFYWMVTGKKLDLKKPQGFNEKLQWLKLHEDYSKYRDYADKIKVRDVIKEKVGDGYMFPILGQWKSFDEIDFNSLPEEFVLKCNHDSGSVKIIRNKSNLTKKEMKSLRAFFNVRMKRDFFIMGREPCYKGIDRYIFAEQFMHDDIATSRGIRDYKFFCFNGKPHIMFIATDRITDTRFDFYDMDFNHLDITNIHPQSGKIIEKPANFEKMKELAAQLSAGIKFVRIDFYEIDDKIYFGEFTFFHGGGFNQFIPDYWERKLGDLIDISD